MIMVNIPVLMEFIIHPNFFLSENFHSLEVIILEVS
jgi:hypothetical protein